MNPNHSSPVAISQSGQLSAGSPADMSLMENFLPEDEARDYLHILLNQIDWRSDEVQVFGRTHPIPRLHQWYADEGLNYRWSGLDMTPMAWTEPLLELRARVETYCGTSFNSVLCNLYRDGNDSMGWHADDEPELGEQPVIVSLSLGASRDFQLRRKGASRVGQSLILPSGSLLVMQGRSQHDWQHALPKRKRVSEPRINLTFRQLFKD